MLSPDWDILDIRGDWKIQIYFKQHTVCTSNNKHLINKLHSPFPSLDYSSRMPPKINNNKCHLYDPSLWYRKINKKE